MVKTLRLIPKAVREYFKPKDNSPIGELLDGYGGVGDKVVTYRIQLKNQLRILRVAARRRHPEVVVRTLRILNEPTPRKEDIEFVYKFVIGWVESKVLGGKCIYEFNYIHEFLMDFYEDYGLTLHAEVFGDKPSVGIDANTHLAVDKSHVYLLKSVKAINLTQEQLNSQYRKAYCSYIDSSYHQDRYLIPVHILEK